SEHDIDRGTLTPQRGADSLRANPNCDQETQPTENPAVRHATLALLSVALSGFFPAGRAAAQEKPNIIFSLADDLGYADLGCYGARGFATANLDRMAKEGLRLTSFYTGCSVCSGSRAAFLTGRHYQRVGVPPVLFPANKNGLNPNEITV